MPIKLVRPPSNLTQTQFNLDRLSNSFVSCYNNEINNKNKIYINFDLKIFKTFTLASDTKIYFLMKLMFLKLSDQMRSNIKMLSDMYIYFFHFKIAFLKQ